MIQTISARHALAAAFAAQFHVIRVTDLIEPKILHQAPEIFETITDYVLPSGITRFSLVRVEISSNQFQVSQPRPGAVLLNFPEALLDPEDEDDLKEEREFQAELQAYIENDGDPRYFSPENH